VYPGPLLSRARRLRRGCPSSLRPTPTLPSKSTARPSRGGVRHEDLDCHDEPGDPTAPGTVAAQKKSPIAQERDEEEERAIWRKEAVGIAPQLFVWVDECGTNTSMTRTKARAPEGERASKARCQGTAGPTRR
jgi:hypothetical protein